MTKQKLDEQIGSLSAVYYVTMEALNLMNSKLDLMMFHSGQTFTHEAKFHYNLMKRGLKTMKQGMDFFELNVIPLLVTEDGQTDCVNTSTALLKDANQVVRTLCRMYNKNIKSTTISEEIIESFNLRLPDEDEGTDSPGSEESQ